MVRTRRNPFPAPAWNRTLVVQPIAQSPIHYTDGVPLVSKHFMKRILFVITPPLHFIPLSKSTVQSPWKPDSHSASEETPYLLWNQKVHYRVNNSPPLAHILSQTNPVHKIPPYFPKIYSNIIIPSTPRSSKWSFPSGFPTKILYAFLVSPICAFNVVAVCTGGNYAQKWITKLYNY